MSNHSIKYPSYHGLLQKLKSQHPHQVSFATAIFLRIGVPAAEALLETACNRRLKKENRLRFLELARQIGVPLNYRNCQLLQDLLEEESLEIAKLAGQIVADASPHGAKAISALPFVTGRPFGLKSLLKKRRKKSLWQLPQSGLNGPIQL